MSDVPKSRRKKSKFQTDTNLADLAVEVQRLSESNFGFSPMRYEREIERYANAHRNAPNVEDQVIARRERLRHFVNIMIPEAQKEINGLVSGAIREFGIANSIFPSDTAAHDEEYKQRRLHMNEAIGYLYATEKHLQMIVRVLPLDVNKFDDLLDRIDEEISMIKGVRQADNRFMKKKGNKKNREERDADMPDVISE